MGQDKCNEAVNVGCWVKIAGFEPDEVETYHIVDDAAAKPQEFKIGESSPLAQALLQKEVGSKIPFHTPVGDVKLTVVEVGTD